MLLKQERPEMDDFERRKKTLVLKEKDINFNIWLILKNVRDFSYATK